MHIIVIGGGVIGLTTAHYLRRGGAEVTLIDKNTQPALGTSYANAGSMTASRAGPWASPRAIAKTLKGYFDQDSAFKLKLQPDTRQWRWLAGFLQSAYSDHTSAKRMAMVTLARDSIAERRQLDQALQLDYGGIYPGLLTVYENAEDFDAASRDVEYLRRLGITVQTLSASECAQVIPTAAWGNLPVVGATLTTDDETGDCHRFCQALDAANATMGIDCRYGEEVKQLDTRRFGQCLVTTNTGATHADGVVIAAGIQSIDLARSQGVRLPMYPVKGYSLSIPLAQELIPPMTISHERRKVFVSPSATGLRAAGVADIVGYDTGTDGTRMGLVRRTVADFFPGADQSVGMGEWAGLRPMTFDGPPIICGVEGTGLWLNTGHGSLGWTMSLGAAKLLADLVQQQKYQPDPAYFGLALR